MDDYEVIDVHVHTYPAPEIGLQAQAGRGRAGCFGTPEELLGIMQRAGIMRAVQVNMTPARSMFDAARARLSSATETPELEAIREKIAGRVIRRNEWTCRIAGENPELAPFPSVDPLMGEATMVAELRDKVENHGAKGLKLHPAEGCFSPNDRVLWPVYKACEDLGMPIISHGGLFATGVAYARPANFVDVLREFPGLTLVIAHLGLGYIEESIQLAGEFPNVYFDTSGAVHGAEGKVPLSDDEAVGLIRKLGTERVMFGSDFPWYHPGKDLKRFLNLGLSGQEKRAILSENARRILHIV